MSDQCPWRASGTIVQATTPELQFTIPGLDLTSCREVHVYFKRKEHIVDCVGTDKVVVDYDSTSDSTTLTVRLSDSETLSMSEGESEVQAHWVNQNGTVDATYPPVLINVGKILNPHVITQNGE